MIFPAIFSSLSDLHRHTYLLVLNCSSLRLNCCLQLYFIVVLIHIFKATLAVSSEWCVSVISDQTVIILFYILVTTKFICELQPLISQCRTHVDLCWWWASWPWGRSGVTVRLQQAIVNFQMNRPSETVLETIQLLSATLLSRPPPRLPDLARYASIQTLVASVCPLLTSMFFLS